MVAEPRHGQLACDHPEKTRQGYKGRRGRPNAESVVNHTYEEAQCDGKNVVLHRTHPTSLVILTRK